MQVYIVLDVHTYNPLGVFNDFELAKESGERVTKNKFIIVKYILNQECNYTINNVYESPNSSSFQSGLQSMNYLRLMDRLDEECDNCGGEDCIRDGMCVNDNFD